MGLGTVLYQAAYGLFVAVPEILVTPLWCLYYALPSSRPVPQWTFQQAIRVRFVKRMIYHWSVLRTPPAQSLAPGPEGRRFVVISPAKPQRYRGPVQDDKIAPAGVGATWTPEPLRPGQTPKMVVLHFHGGAYVIGSGRDDDTGFLAETLIRHMGCSHVLTPQYRLSSHPGGCFPAALQDALASYCYLVDDLGVPASRVVVSGDSAGGNVALGLARYITEHGPALGIPAPGAVALWSPWVDLASALDPQTLVRSANYHSDYLSVEFGMWGATTVTDSGRIDPEGPYLSPLRHPLRLSAPVFVQTGEREVLFQDNAQLVEQLRGLGVPAELVVSKHCPHDIMLAGPMAGFQEQAQEAARRAGDFLQTHRRG